MITRRCILAACGGIAATAAVKSTAAQTPIQSVPKTARNRTMEIRRIGSQPSGKGPPDYFTGTVRIDPLFQAPDLARGAGASVTFEPGARTAWHTHPLGQTLIVTAGVGWVQRWSGPVEEIRPGDVVSARRETLARRNAHDGDDAYRHSGAARWQGRGLDGTGERRPIPAPVMMTTLAMTTHHRI
jgi:quercetin dioxygenase-like cupin family protein